MFEIHYDDLIFLFTLSGIVCLALTFFFQLFHGLWKRFRNKKLKVKCHICNYHFLNRGRQKLIACPNCGALNEPGKDRRL